MRKPIFNAFLVTLLTFPWFIQALVLPTTFQPTVINVANVEPQRSVSQDVDIVVEADTYTPYFYQGRAEPTVGNLVRLVAIPRAALVSDEDLTYRWSINGIVQGETGERLTARVPVLSNLLVKVQVFANNSLIAAKEEHIGISLPRVLFYEQNSLRGSSQQAVVQEHVAVGPEITVKVEPYFIGKADAPPQMLTGWTANGSTITTRDWRSITIANQNAGGAPITFEFKLQHRGTFLEAKNHFLLHMGI